MEHRQEKVARVQRRGERRAPMLTDVAGAVRNLEARMDQRFSGGESRLTALDQKIDRKSEALDQKIEAVHGKLEAKIDGLGVRIDGIETRLQQNIGTLEVKMDSHFRWIVGIQFAMLIAMLASFMGG